MRRRLLVLGNGWGGMRVLRDIDKRKYRVTNVAPRNHFVFTPLLASTAVGTLEFRNVCEPVRQVAPDVEFYQAECLSIDIHRRIAYCASVHSQDHIIPSLRFSHSKNESSPYHSLIHPPQDPPSAQDQALTLNTQRQVFQLEFDDLVIAVGSESNTFNAPGVEDYAFFLKDVTDAQRIRLRIIHNFELASSPCCTVETARTLLHFVVVGGGPTGVEFAAELTDFLNQDLHKAFGDIAKLSRVTVLDASGSLLPSFDRKLSDWAMRRFRKRNIDVRRGAVAAVGPHSVTLVNGQTVSCGMAVWSTGVTAVPFVREDTRHGLALHERSRRLRVDPFLRCFPRPGLALPPPDPHRNEDGTYTHHQDAHISIDPPPLDYIFAIGDCADIGTPSIPMTAQAAQQQAIYLAALLNRTHDYVGDRWELEPFVPTTGGTQSQRAPRPTSRPPKDGHSSPHTPPTTSSPDAPTRPTTCASSPPDASTQTGHTGPATHTPNTPPPPLSRTSQLALVRGVLASPWLFRNRGQMAYIGGYRALVQFPELSATGLGAWLLWRGAYFTMLVSWRNKFLVPMQWFKTWLFGRDISYLYDWRKVCRKFPVQPPKPYSTSPNVQQPPTNESSEDNSEDPHSPEFYKALAAAQKRRELERKNKNK